MNLLADCCNLTKINTTPQKAAKSFFTESSYLLQTLAFAADCNKDATSNAITFDKDCHTIKEDDESVV